MAFSVRMPVFGSVFSTVGVLEGLGAGVSLIGEDGAGMAGAASDGFCGGNGSMGIRSMLSVGFAFSAGLAFSGMR